jgi:hypothetical protein
MKIAFYFFTLLATALTANAASNNCDLRNIESLTAQQASSCGDLAVQTNDGSSAVKFYCYAYQKNADAHALVALMLITINTDDIYKDAESEAEACTYEYRKSVVN